MKTYDIGTQRDVVEAMLLHMDANSSTTVRSASIWLDSHYSQNRPGVPRLAPVAKTMERWTTYFINTGRLACQDWGQVEADILKVKYSTMEPAVAELKKILDENPRFFITEIVKKLADQTGTLYSQSTVYRCMCEKLGYSHQKVQLIPRQMSIVEKANYDIALAAVVSNAKQVVYIDEAHKSPAEEERKFGWFVRGQGATKLLEYLAHTSSGFTLHGAVDIFGFILEMCRVRDMGIGKTDPNPAKGTVDSDVFADYIEEAVGPFMGNYQKLEQRSILVLDNAPNHFSPRLEGIAKKFGFKLLYLYPYGFDDNPIESCFFQYKSSLRATSLNASLSRDEGHDIALSSVSHDNMI